MFTSYYSEGMAGGRFNYYAVSSSLDMCLDITVFSVINITEM